MGERNIKTLFYHLLNNERENGLMKKNVQVYRKNITEKLYCNLTLLKNI